MTPILLDGTWRDARSTRSFQAIDPTTRQPFGDTFPESDWSEFNDALAAAQGAFEEMRHDGPRRLVEFLRTYADRIDAHATELAEIATKETALPAGPRLLENEIPRTTHQLREAAGSAAEGSWALPTIDTKNHLRSCLNPIGPAIVMGPANFPFAYNAIAGGDFASAIATGCPVIAKGHPAHPNTTRKLAELAREAVAHAGLPPAAVQLIYHCSPDVGLRAVEDPRCAAIAFTGSRPAGMALRDAAHRGGKPAWLEMSSVNPVILLPGALNERFEEVVDQFVASSQLAVGQMCTNPGVVLLLEDAASKRFVNDVVERFRSAPTGVLLTEGIETSLEKNVKKLTDTGAELAIGGQRARHGGFGFQPTLLRLTGDAFLRQPELFQTELFGPACLVVLARCRTTRPDRPLARRQPHRQRLHRAQHGRR
ncbi:MAG: aldehyde dehydrogenase family protein [Tepidisphaeraceae bacterium]